MNKASGGDGIPADLFQILKDGSCESAALNMPANLENTAMATGCKRSVFIPIPKNGSAKECSNYCTTALISQASKVILKILKAKLQQYMNRELSDVQAGFRKGRGTEIKLPTYVGSSKKQQCSRKTPTSALLTMPKPLTAQTTTNSGNFLKRWEYQTTLPAS